MMNDYVRGQEVPKVWGVPYSVSVKLENFDGIDEPFVVLRAKVHGSNDREYVESFCLSNSPSLKNSFAGEGSELALAYITNLILALMTDIQLDFGISPLPDFIVPREQTQGELNGAGHATE